MKNKHTPGPWTVCGASVVKGSRRHPICDTYMWASNSSGTGPEITKANARLIASAPELLEALQDIRTWLISPSVTNGTLEEISALCDVAIAKATGGAS